MKVRVQMQVRGIFERGKEVIDDRNLCGCLDFRPECSGQPCVAFEDVLKLNLLTSCMMSGSPPDTTRLRFHVTEIQLLKRAEGFSAYEVVDLALQEEEIVSTSANSPLLKALLDTLNNNLPVLPVPPSALTLNGNVIPKNLVLFSKRVDGSGLGIQDYIGIRADVETTSTLLSSGTSEALSNWKKKLTSPNDHPVMATPEQTRTIQDVLKSNNAFDKGITLVNIPNPFNSNTEIRFSIKKEGKVKVEIFNVLGQKVRTLVDDYLSVGDHRMNWDGRLGDGSPAPSGIYMCRLVIDNGVASKKITLLR